MKDGRTRLGHKAEHVTDLETGAIIAASAFPADEADTATAADSLQAAREIILSTVEPDDNDDGDDDDDANTSEPGGSNARGLLTRPEAAMDKGYYKTELLEHLDAVGIRAYIPEPRRPRRRRWTGRSSHSRKVALANRARTR